MSSIYQEKFFLSSSEGNAEQQLSLPELTGNLIAVATSHANSLGIGNPWMEEQNMHAGWVLARLTIEMTQYPEVNETYELKTWMESFTRHFSVRSFSISTDAKGICGYARSIWMVMDTENHTNVGLSHFHLAPELIDGTQVPIPLQAKHTFIFPMEEADKADAHSLTATSPAVKHRFLYCDLDSYRHVNTVRYVSLLLNQFTLKEHDDNMVNRLELSFLHEAKYGKETLLLRSEDKTERINSFLLLDGEDKSPLMFARLFMKSRN